MPYRLCRTIEDGQMRYETLNNCFRRNCTVPGVVLVFAAVYVLMLAIEAEEVGAAWIQAFGSIGAILAATYIAHEDRRVERLRERRKEAVICLALLYQVEEAKAILYTQSILLRYEHQGALTVTKSTVDRSMASLRDTIQRLRSIDRTSLPDPILVNVLVDIIRQLEDAAWIAEAEELLTLIESHGPIGPFKDSIEQVEKGIEVIRKFTEPC